MRVPWNARRSNQSILKEINPGCSLKGVMLRLKLQYLATSCEELTHWKKTLMLGRDWGQEEKGTTEDEMAGSDCGQEEKGMTEDEMAGWHH